MLLIQRAQANTLILTLKEKVTLASPTYLFSFKNRATMAVTNFIMADTSSYTDRYNKFVLTEGVTATFVDQGFYDYTVYQQTSVSNTNPASTEGILETGIAKVFATSNNTFIEKNYSNNDTFIEYGSGA